MCFQVTMYLLRVLVDEQFLRHYVFTQSLGYKSVYWGLSTMWYASLILRSLILCMLALMAYLHLMGASPSYVWKISTLRLVATVTGWPQSSRNLTEV
jgi:hypothetical protein